MRKLLLLLFLPLWLTAQVVPPDATPLENIQITNNIQSTTATKVTVRENNGVQNWVNNQDISIPFVPVNFPSTSQTIGGMLAGIDVKFGQQQTTAGQTARVNFTADNVTVNSIGYFQSSTTGKGTSTAGSPPTLSLGDNVKLFFTKDIISILQPSLVQYPAGTYAGQLTVSATPTPNATQQRFTIEIYKTDSNGVAIASGVSGAPIGSLGVAVITVLDSGIINLTAGAISNVSVLGQLLAQLTINPNERIKYHVSAQKVGTGGGNVTMQVYYGSNYNSYYDVPIPITTDAVLNKSTVSGVNATDALNSLNSLNTLKANDASVVHKTGNLSESVDGQKTFTSQTNFNAPVFFPANVISASSTKPMIGGVLGDLFLYSARTGADQVGIRFKTNTLTGTRTHTAPNKDGTYALISQTITNGVTENSPSEDAIFDALALKANDSDVIKTTGNQAKNGNLTVNNLNLPAQPIGAPIYKIGGSMGTNDSWAIYGEAYTMNKGIMVFEVGDDGAPFEPSGEKFEFRYGNLDTGTPKTPFTIDYNLITSLNPIYRPITTLGTVVAPFYEKLLIGYAFGTNESAISVGNSGTMDQASYLKFTVNGRVSASTPIDVLKLSPEGADLTGLVKISSLSGIGTRTVVADASGNLSTTDVAPTSGTYTPTVTVSTNVTSASLVRATYSRIGNIITVSFQISVTPTGSTGATVLMSLPVNRATASYIGIGSATGVQSFVILPVQVLSQSTNTAMINFTSSGTASTSISGTFQYSTTE